MAGQGYGQRPRLRLPSVAHNGFIVFARSARDLARVGKGFRRSHACKGTGRCRNGEMARGGVYFSGRWKFAEGGYFLRGAPSPPPAPGNATMIPAVCGGTVKAGISVGWQITENKGGVEPCSPRSQDAANRSSERTCVGKGGVERAGGGARFDELRRKVKIPTNGVGPHA